MITLAHAWVLTILPLPLLLRWLLPAWRESRPAVRIPFLDEIAARAGVSPASGAAARRRSRLQALLFAVCWTAVVAALARPQWLEPPIVETRPTRDLLLAVDLSGSMETRDMQDADGAEVDRLAAVKNVLADFLVRREGDRVGLVVFGNAAFVQAPFTTDLDAVRRLLEETAVRMAGPRTAFGDAIGLGITLFEESEFDQRVMIVLTDGNDTGSLVPPPEAAQIAAGRGIVIHTVAIGDPTTAGEEAFDEAGLEAVARRTGGRYFHAADTSDLEDVYEALDRLEVREMDSISYRPRRDLFHWPLGAALLLALGYHLAAALRAHRRVRDFPQTVDG